MQRVPANATSVFQLEKHTAKILRTYKQGPLVLNHNHPHTNSLSTVNTVDKAISSLFFSRLQVWYQEMAAF